MTVSSTINRNDYIGTGSTATYAYTFRIFAKTDLRVIKRDTDGVETVLTVDTDYTVTGVGSFNGGNVVLAAGNLPAGYALTIRIKLPLKQETDLRNQGAFFPEVHENVFDRLLKIDQQQSDELDRSFKLPETEAGSAAATGLPAAAQRANKFLAFDEDGNPIVAKGVPDVPATAFAATLLDDETAAAARATLGVGAQTDFATVAALRANQIAAYDGCRTKGYYSAGDGGAAFYYRDDADTSTADDGFLCIVDAGDRRWKLNKPGFINVKWSGAKGDGTTDDTSALQAVLTYASGMSGYDEIIPVIFSSPAVYITTKPLTFYGDNLYIEGSGCTVRKTTDDLPAATISNRNNGTGDIDPNVNAIFLSSDRVRWLRMKNFNLEGESGTSTPIGVWFFGYENHLENIFPRNVSVGVHCPSSWMTTLRRVVVRNSTSHGIWWDRARVSGVGQSGTSLHLDNCAVFNPGGKGFYLQDCDYAKLSACACDLAAEEAYYFQGCSGLNAHIAWESRDAVSTTPAVRFADTSGTAVIDSYDPSTFTQEAIKLTGSNILFAGRLRVDHTVWFDLSLASKAVIQNLHRDPISGSDTSSRYVTADTSKVYFGDWVDARRDGNPPGLFDRLTSDGDVISLRKDGVVVGKLASRAGALTNLILDPRDTAGNGAGIGATGEAVLPTDHLSIADNHTALGSATHRWKEVFAATGAINTSDAREKTSVRPLSGAELAAARDLGREIGAFQWLASLERKGETARQHVGMTVQRAIEIMEAHGLNPFGYGFICFDRWEADDDAEAGDRYGFRTDQLALFLLRGIEARTAALEALLGE